MRRVAWLFLLFLAACTGTSETEPPVVVAVATDQAITFHDAHALNQGQWAEIGRWSIAGTKDLLVSGDRLFVLSAGTLFRYRLDGFSLSAIPAPAAALEASWSLGDCQGTAFKAGRQDLIVLCQGGSVLRLAQNAPPGTEPVPAPVASFPPETTYALYPTNSGDKLAAAYPSAGGVVLEIPDLGTNLQIPTNLQLQGLALAWDGQNLGLMASGPGGTQIFRWRQGQTAPERLAEDGQVEARGLLGAAGLWLAYGQGYLLADSNRTASGQAFTRFQAAWLHPDLYLYLAGDNFTVLDVAALPPTTLANLPGTAGIVAITGWVLP